MRERGAYFLDHLGVKDTPASTLFKTARANPCRDRAVDRDFNTGPSPNRNHGGVNTLMISKKHAVCARSMSNVKMAYRTSEECQNNGVHGTYNTNSPRYEQSG